MIKKHPEKSIGYFDRSCTTAIKGIAIILMLAHHCMYASDKMWIDMPEIHRLFPVAIGEFSMDQAMSRFGQICVSLFMFLGGYGLYCQQEKNGFSLSKKILNLYLKYWQYFCFFVPIGILFFRHQSDYMVKNVFCHVFDNHNIENIISSFVGWSFDYNREWWFLQSYLVYIILTFAFIHTSKKIDNIWHDMLLIALINIILSGVIPVLNGYEQLSSFSNHHLVQLLSLYDNAACGCCCFMGAVFAKYDGIRILKELLFAKKESWILAAIGVIIVFYMRVCIVGKVFDFLYCPIFIVCTWTILDALKLLKVVFGFVGKYSTGMWLTHTFFLWYFEPTCKFIYSFGNLWISLAVLIVISLIVTIIFENVMSFIAKHGGEFFERVCNG